MKLARYIGGGIVSIVEEPAPECPAGGLLVRTEASGLCSGELMSWYMDQKIPHVLGHEVAGEVIASEDPRFPVGSHVFPHHHAPCLQCEECRAERYVHCPQWRRTKLRPGGMAESFAVAPENLNDTLLVDGMRPVDAALIEPLACVMKSLRVSGGRMNQSFTVPGRAAVIGLGVMGLMHALLLGASAVAYDLNPARRDWARGLGIDARPLEDGTPADVIFVCPGSQAAFDAALKLAAPAATIVLFAPVGPGEHLAVPQSAYFQDIGIVHSYSCGPNDTVAARDALRDGRLAAEQVVSQFIGIDDLPVAYGQMKRGEILKPMVVF